MDLGMISSDLEGWCAHSKDNAVMKCKLAAGNYRLREVAAVSPRPEIDTDAAKSCSHACRQQAVGRGASSAFSGP
jgi:hypothetical protein